MVKQRFIKKKDEKDYVYSSISKEPADGVRVHLHQSLQHHSPKGRALMNLFLLMIPASMPELTNRGDVSYSATNSSSLSTIARPPKR